MIAVALLVFAPATQAPVAPASKPATPRFGAFLEQIDHRPNSGFGAFDAQGKLWTVPSAKPLLGVNPGYEEASRAAKLGQCDAPGSATGGIAFESWGSFYVVQPGGDAIDHHPERDLESDGLGSLSSYEGSGHPFSQRGSGPGELHGASGIAFDSRDDCADIGPVRPARVLVADTLNHRISVFDADGKPLSTFGSFGAGDGRLNHPNDVAVDDLGAAYVADVGNDRIVKFDSQGKFVKSFGGRGSYPGLFAAPTGIDVFRDQLFVADRDNHRIEVFDLDGNFVYEWGVHALLPREGHGKLHYPTDVAVSPKGDRVAVVEEMEDRVQFFGPAKEDTVLTTGERDTAAHYGGYCSVRRDLFAICEPSGPSVSIFDLTRGTPIEITRFGRPGSVAGRMLRPTSVLLDEKAEMVYVADPFAYRISAFRISRKPDEPLRFDPFLAQFVRSVDLTANDLPLRGTWNIEPRGMALGEHGEILVADGANDRVVVFNADLVPVRALSAQGLVQPSGVALNRLTGDTFVAGFDPIWLGSTTCFARDGSTRATIAPHQPFGIALVGAGSAWFSDRLLGNVSKFDLSKAPGVILPPAFWGNKPTPTGHLGRGEFFKPEGIATDEHGRVYVVDAGNHRFQILDADGTYLDMFGARFYTEAGRTPTAPAPAPNAWDGANELTTNDGTWRVLWRARTTPIPRGTPFAIDAWVFARGEPRVPARDVSLGVDAWMPEHLHGMNRVPRIMRRDDGGFTVEGLLFHMSGRWELDLDVVAKSVTERAAVRIDLE